ncbi:hypothetical protein MPHO_24400 [Mycolicibacterium phocaicum]|nr:hypothetical protein MPHO_24400 [Mycolicibacterium phocaicum]
MKAGSHPYDYYWRPGAALRPAPPRLRFEPMWTYTRRQLFTPWMEFREVPRSTAWTDLFVDHLWQGDELMDAVVARFRAMGMADGRAMLDRALDHGIDAVPNAPAELVALFNQLDNPPAWYDPQQWEAGRRLWIDASLAGKVGMFAGDTFGTFVGDEVAYATGQTGRFVSDFYRRNLETLAWFRNMTYPGALERWAEPFKDTVRVRLMHSQVRAGLRQTWGDEQFAHHGNPISNAMMMNAAISFGLQPLLVDHAHGRTLQQRGSRCGADVLGLHRPRLRGGGGTHPEEYRRSHRSHGLHSGVCRWPVGVDGHHGRRRHRRAERGRNDQARLGYTTARAAGLLRR